jgi:hypothetical protein
VSSNFDIAAKRHPRGIGSAFHRAGKIHKKMIYILEYQIVITI